MITSNSYPTHKSAISDFWGKEVSDLTDLTIVMRKDLNFNENLEIDDSDDKLILIPYYKYKSRLLKGLSIIMFYINLFFTVRKKVINNKIDIIHSYNSSFASALVSFLNVNSFHSLGWSSDFISMQKYSSRNRGRVYKLINSIILSFEPTSILKLCSTNSVHSVSSLKVIHGFEKKNASF